MSTAYRPIGDYALIGNLRTAALVAPDGAIEWCCLPDFDSPSVFAAILDHQRGGRFRVGVEGGTSVTQRYVIHTNVLETIFHSEHGRLVLSDFMPLRGNLNDARGSETRPGIWRMLHAEGGPVEADVEWAPRPDYGRASLDMAKTEHGLVATSDATAYALSGLTPTELDNAVIRAGADGQPSMHARLHLEAGEKRLLVCSPGERPEQVDIEVGDAWRADTIAAWRRWLHKIGVAERAWARPYQDLVTRAELALKLMCYPTGAIVAAPTTSLPEWIGGVRNWDYRYSWIRDAALAVRALHAVGHEDEARAFILWAERMAQETTDAPKTVQIMYGIRGDTDLPEQELDHLEGHRGSRPVRIGNGAAKQKQLDVYGELLDGAHELVRDGDQLPDDVLRFLCEVADSACDRLDETDEGIWEVRKEGKHFTYSKMMLWVCLDRAVCMGERGLLQGDVDHWRERREEASRMVLERGYNDSRKAFTQTLEGHDLDASLLLMPALGIVEPTDPRMLNTIDAMLQELTDHDLVYRYHADDGLPGGEGAFLLCTFWMVDALALAGRLDEADRIFESMLRRANHVGLYSEQIEPSTGEFLGNFPQAFSHLGLINSAISLARARGIFESGPHAKPPGSHDH
ncbi:MAG TPA: glycoside hydrolase family 15 protein [Candidatus Limnocylindrales bacterium]|nr:glycoside hydrolase family 15 protein [Candidatus Limnocylindrales bacterium]